MIYVEKIKTNIHNKIKQHVLSITNDINWHAKYYPRCDVLIADISVNGSTFEVPLLLKTVEEIHNNLYDTPMVGIEWWINKYPSRSYQELHNHTLDNVKTIAWNYFLHLPPNSGSFVAGNTVLGDDMEGTIVFFPPDVMHEVTPNNSNDIRYTIAGNIVYDYI